MPERNGVADANEGTPGGHDFTRDLAPGAVAPHRQHDGRPDEIRLPFSIEEVDPSVAKARLTNPISVASGVVGSVDEFGYRALVEAMVDLLVETRCRTGLTIADLVAAARIGRGHLSERFGIPWQLVTDLVVRATAAQAGRPGLYQEIVSRPVNVRRRHRGLGADKRPKGPKALHYIFSALACSDRHCPTFARPFTAGTQDDHTSERANPDRIEEWNSQLGHPPAGPPHEHVKEILTCETQARARFAQAATQAPEVFVAPLVPECLRDAFPRWLLIADLPFGPPPSSEVSKHGRYPAGRDNRIVHLVQAARRWGVLYAGAFLSDQEQAELENDLVPLNVGRLPETYPLGITRLPNLRYRWSASREMLAREVVGEGARTELWRLVSVPEERLLGAISIIERHAQNTLPPACLERWIEDCAPGLMQARNALVCGGCIDVMDAANAGIVDANRRRN